jgi:hypothetical protein
MNVYFLFIFLKQLVTIITTNAKMMFPELTIPTWSTADAAVADRESMMSRSSSRRPSYNNNNNNSNNNAVMMLGCCCAAHGPTCPHLNHNHLNHNLHQQNTQNQNPIQQQNLSPMNFFNNGHGQAPAGGHYMSNHQHGNSINMNGCGNNIMTQSQTSVYSIGSHGSSSQLGQ